MNGFYILIIGTILLNALFSLVPIFWPDADLGTYLPYQFWFNILLLFIWILPQYKGNYLFDKNVVAKPASADVDMQTNPMFNPRPPPGSSPEPTDSAVKQPSEK